MNEEELKEMMSIDSMLDFSQKVFEAVAPVVDNQMKQGAGIAEITLGIADGIKKLLCSYAVAHVPQLNAEPVIKMATIWMQSDIEGEEDNINKALESFLEGKEKPLFK